MVKKCRQGMKWVGIGSDRIGSLIRAKQRGEGKEGREGRKGGREGKEGLPPRDLKIGKVRYAWNGI